MIGEPRTIARMLDLVHFPLQHDVEQLRAIYFKISGSCGYDNFTKRSGGAHLDAAPAEGGGASRVSFLRDRISFQEERGKSTQETFLGRVREVVGVAVQTLPIPVFVLRSVTVRALTAAPSGRGAEQFIGENLFRLSADELAKIGRPVQIGGLRLHLPAADESQGSHQIRIESYLRDTRSIYVEDVATFKMPVPSQDLDRIAQEIEEVENMMQENLSTFLNQFPR